MNLFHCIEPTFCFCYCTWSVNPCFHYVYTFMLFKTFTAYFDYIYCKIYTDHILFRIDFVIFCLEVDFTYFV